MDIMIDLETMGLGPSPAIVQIGAVLFQPMMAFGDGSDIAIYPTTFKRTISLQSSLLAGASMDQSTLEWWLSQSDEAKQSISEEAVSLRQALLDFTEFCSEHGVSQIWSHGAASDVPWLEASYKLLKLEAPWRHTQVRDTRTLFWMAGLTGWDRLQDWGGTAHDALDDARRQAADVLSALKHIDMVGLTLPSN